MTEPQQQSSAGIESAGFSDIEAAQAIASIANECCYRSDGWEEHIAEEGLKIIRSIRGVPDVAQSVQVRAEAIEECAKIADHEAALWPSHIGSSARVSAMKMRALASQPSPAATVETPPRAWLEAKAEVDAGWPERCSAGNVDAAKALELATKLDYARHSRITHGVRVDLDYQEMDLARDALRIAAQPQPVGMRDTMIRGMQAAFDEVAEYLEQQNAGGFAAHIRRRSVSLSRPQSRTGEA